MAYKISHVILLLMEYKKLIKQVKARLFIYNDRVYNIQDLQIGNRGIWHDAFGKMPLNKRTYYLSLLRRGAKLTGTPRVIIDTIHGVKGGEADNVAVMLDMTNRSYQNLQFDPDDEYRVFYVGFTRAKKALHILLPTGIRYFPYD